MTAEKLLAHAKAGEIITVRAKNGDCYPSFSRRPGAYRCTVGKQRIAGAVVWALTKRRLIVPVKMGWYSEGQFKFNKNLRDKRGRFQPRSRSPQESETP